MKNDRIYLDYNATTPVDPEVLAVVMECMGVKWGNPSSMHGEGREASSLVSGARGDVAKLINAEAERVFFTSGGTEGDNQAILGTYRKHEKKARQKILVSAVEHPAVMEAAAEATRLGARVEKIPVDPSGRIDEKAYLEMLDDDVLLVSMMLASNELGTIQDIKKLSVMAHERGAIFHTDAVQALGKIPVDVQDLDVDLCTISSHKVYGPKGVGALYVKRGGALSPRSFGGHQEKNIRVGTENVPGIAGFGTACRLCLEKMEEEQKEIKRLRDILERNILESLEDVEIRVNGGETRLGNTLNLSFKGVEGEIIVMRADMGGVAISTGAACSSGAAEASSVLKAIGLSGEWLQGSVRISLGRFTTEEEIQKASKILKDTVLKCRN